MRKLIITLGLLFLLQLAWVPTSQAAAPLESEGFWHTVQRGETLFSIGRRYGVNPYAICRANGLYNCSFIWAGQRLFIPYDHSGPQHPICSFTHYVQRGQTLYSISRNYGVPLWVIVRANGIHNPNYIYVGQRLCIP